ncbi:hypothetical protein D3C83_144080 [compost metagenome]
MAEFVDHANSDYRLRSDSRFAEAATDGTPLGANIDMIRRRAPDGDRPSPTRRGSDLRQPAP